MRALCQSLARPRGRLFFASSKMTFSGAFSLRENSWMKILLIFVSIVTMFILAEKIRKSVEKEYFVDKDKKLKVTISVGIACVKDGETEIELFERADKVMYVAKRKGRNQVEIAE